MMRGSNDWWSARYAQTFKSGDMVRVTERYDGSGRFANDGNEGLYRVVRPMGGADYYLAKPDSNERWDLISHVSRLQPA